MSDVVKSELLVSGSRFDVRRLTLQGRDGQSYQREFIEHPGAVVLLPVIDDDHLVMIRNDRPGISEVLWELPAGTREVNEPVLETAGRELKEETGYSAERLTSAMEFYSAPGLGDEKMHLIVAEDLTRGEQALEATEQIEPVVVTRSQLQDWLAEGTLRDAKTLIGVQYFLFQWKTGS
ncbi:MAG: NUDIX hydrolase [Planctomycetota bacterium]